MFSCLYFLYMNNSCHIYNDKNWHLKATSYHALWLKYTYQELKALILEPNQGFRQTSCEGKFMDKMEYFNLKIHMEISAKVAPTDSYW